VNTHLKPALGRTLMPQHIQSMIGSKVTEGLSPRTIRGIRAVPRSALSDAVKWRTLNFNAAKAVSLPRAQRVETRVFTPEQARAFVAAAEGDRLGPLFLVALAVGLRLGEALGLRWSSHDFDSRLRCRSPEAPPDDSA
jgi:integrase